MGQAKSPGPGAAPNAPGSSDTSSIPTKHSELREHTRFRMDEAAVHLHLKGFLTPLGIGLKNEARSAVNLSEGGILVITHSKLKPGSRIRIQIDLEKYKDRIQADGEVRWSYQSARDASDFYSGIQFKNLPASQAALIAKMRAWFTSPEYKQKTATRRRLAPPGFELE